MAWAEKVSQAPAPWRPGARVVAADVGALLVIGGFVALFTLPVALWYGEWDAARAMVATVAAFVAPGWLLTRLRPEAEPRRRHAMIIAALGWLAVPLVSAIPFMWVMGLPFVDAYFEAMSAWSGSGFTVLAQESLAPRTLLWWRTLGQWVGGVGVIVLTLSILARPGTGAWTLYHSEAREARLRPSIVGTVRTIWWIYLGYTVASVLLLWAAGMPPWDALNHGLTAIATGGLTVTDESIAAYGSGVVELAAVVPMTFGAIAFATHYRVLQGRVGDLLRDPQVRAMLLVYVVGSAALTWELAAVTGDGWLAFREAGFQVVSAVTTTGFQTADVMAWPATAKALLSVLMIMAGAAGATTGGLKLVRAVLLARGVGYKLRRLQLPANAMVSFDLGGRRLPSVEADAEIAEAAFVGFLWLTLLATGIWVVMHHTPPGFGPVDVFFEMASMQSNVGLSTGLTSAALATPAKAMMVLAMWAGRLEIFPLLVLLRRVVLRRTGY